MAYVGCITEPQLLVESAMVRAYFSRNDIWIQGLLEGYKDI